MLWNTLPLSTSQGQQACRGFICKHTWHTQTVVVTSGWLAVGPQIARPVA